MIRLRRPKVGRTAMLDRRRAARFGGLLVDLILIALPPRRFGRWPLAGLAPAAIFIAYFVVVSRTGPVAWTAHLIGGTVLIAALTGLALALLARPTHDRVPPDEAAPGCVDRSARTPYEDFRSDRRGPVTADMSS